MKKILITGGSSGIGFECVLRFRAEGWHVICCSRREDRWRNKVDMYPELASVEYIQCDVSSEDDVNSLFQQLEVKHSYIDAAINNAAPAVASVGLFKDVDTALMKDTVNNDFLSVVFCIKQELKSVRPGGSIVNITSVNGLRPIPGAALYGASKQAVESITKSIALEAIEDNIRVNSVAPGATWTSRWEERQKENSEIRANAEKEIPIQRFAMPSEIANTAFWLISDQASYIVGHTLIVDGGLSLK